ncbi:MAG: TasA family protein [Bacillota bacterium]
MKKKLLLLTLALLLVAGMAGAGTFAYFTDTETSTGNTFTAGTLDLKIKDGGSNWNDGIVAEWSMSNMIPGVTTAYGSIDLKEVGSLTADHLKITCSYTVDDTPDVESDSNWATTGDDFAKYVEITELIYKNSTWQIVYNGSNWYVAGSPPYPSGYQEGDWEVSNSDGVPGISLADLAADPLDNLPPPDGLLETQFDLTLKFRSDAGNDLQGDTLNVTMIFTLNQDASQ